MHTYRLQTLNRLIHFLIIFLYSGFIFSQKITLNTIPQLDKSPSNSVTRVYQDKNGYLWLGTMDGISRYDGNTLLSFRSDIKRNHLLSNNQITSITEDANNIWIGTEEGINLLDKKTYIIQPFRDSDIQNQSIKSILIDQDQSIWIGTGSSLYHYSKDHKLIKKFSEYPQNLINQIFQDLDNNIWILSWNLGLLKYNRTNSSLEQYPKIGEKNSPFRMMQDSNKQYWICTWGDGIFLFNPEADKNKIYQHQEIKTTNGSNGTYFSIIQDDIKKYIWVMSFSGIQAFTYSNPKNPLLEEIDVKYLFEDSNNIFSELIKDKRGNIWIGTYNEGVSTINFDKPEIKNYSLDFMKKRFDVAANIKAIFQDKDKLFWLFQNRIGLATYNSFSDSFKLYNEYNELKNIDELKNINCITEPNSLKNEIWIGPENEEAIIQLEKTANDIHLKGKIDLTTLTQKPGVPLLFFNDKSNNTWIGTTNSLFVKYYQRDNIILVSDTIGNVTSITEDNLDNIYISTSKSGIYRTKRDNNRAERIKENSAYDNIQTICVDSKNQLWIGTKQGKVELFDIIKNTTDDYTQECGTDGNPILNIITDHNANVWILTSRSVTEYNTQNKAHHNYNIDDGINVNYFHKNSLYKNKNGSLFFGGNKGFVELKSSNTLSLSSPKERVYITDIEIQGTSVFYNNQNYKFDIKNQALRLNPEDKNIEIRFASMYYTYKSKIKYSYKLEGIDENWVYTDSQRQFATYNFLDKGTYKFKVRSTDENGIWNDDITILTIQRLPAFYETWWAFFIYILIIISVLSAAYIYTRHRIRLKNKLKIAHIEKQKTEELTQSKLKYFTNISHDFLTPLTIISCIIEDLEPTLKKETPQYETINSNINKLKRLLQQILDFRKVESGNMKLKVSNSDIILFLKNICYTSFLPLFKKNNINFSFDSEYESINAYFDSDKLEKIVFNLLSNALKYTPNGGSTDFSVKQEILDNHKYIILKITDSGIGISEKNLERVFNRFYTDKDQKNESNGIGLSLTKDLTELHHGRITVSSTLNIGSTFTVMLPISKESYSEYEIVSEQKQDQLYCRNNNMCDKKEKVCILLVEDNDELLLLMKNVLIKNFNVEIANNGKEALSILENKNIDLVISDIMMPLMDGLELCKLIKSNIETSHIPVILLTAKNSSDDRIESYEAGADGYLSKPFELKVLSARINNLVSNKKTKQDEFKTNAEINISALEYTSNDELFLSNAVKLIEEYLAESEFGINTFAEHMNMSKSSLYRKIKSMTGLSPIEFIRNIRLKHACNMLKDKSNSISDVAYSVGFSDPKYFTSCFKSEFGVTPSEYQRTAK